MMAVWMVGYFVYILHGLLVDKSFDVVMVRVVTGLFWPFLLLGEVLHEEENK